MEQQNSTNEPARSYGFGIVGTGTIAPRHAQAIAELPNSYLVAATDIQPRVAADFAGAHSCAVEPSLEALVSRADIDVVCVCVPSGLHAEIGRVAAAAGKHLVVEKPIDVTLAAADTLIAAAQTAGILVTVISQHRFAPDLQELRGLLDRGELGRLVLGEASTKWYRSQGYYDSAGWRGTWALDGGSLMNQGIHYLDLLCWSMGPVAEVTAQYATQAHDIEVEDTITAILNFRSGALGSVVCSTAIMPGFAQRLELNGTRGSVIVENSHIVFRHLTADRGSAAPGPATIKRGSEISTHLDPAGEQPVTALGNGLSPHAAQIADLLAAIAAASGGRHQQQPSVTAAAGRATLEVICAAYQSAVEGRTVAIPDRRQSE